MYNAKVLIATVGLIFTVSSTAAHAQQLYVEYYRSNLFLGLAYHRVGCLTDWSTIRSDQEYDGFSSTGYCFAGGSSSGVPDAEWFAWNYTTGEAQLEACGVQTNTRYGTLNYAERSSTCNYNIVTNCNSDCWIRQFSRCQGKQVPIVSPCW